MRAAGILAKTLLAVAVLAAAAACGGTASGTSVATGGPATVSGGLTGSVTVHGAGQYYSGAGAVIGLNGNASSGLSVLFSLKLPSGTSTVSAGTYTSANVADAVILVGQGNVSYAVYGGTNSSNSSPQGSFTLNVTEAGSTLSGGGGTQWPFMHGTLTATLPADSNTAATGTATLSATF